MNHYVKIALVLCSCLALASAQFGSYGYDFGFGSYNAPNSYNGYAAAAAPQRDARANRGPVLFPPSPNSDSTQTSGVVVGASGYGFVPPGVQGPAIPRFFYRRRLYLRR